MQTGHTRSLGKRWVVLALVGILSQARVDGLMAAEPDQKTRVLVDTDIGSYVDDVFALGLVLASPELKLLGVTCCGAPTDDRAALVCRFIAQCGRDGIPVAAGQLPQPAQELDWQIQYRRHPAAVFNRTVKPSDKPAVELLRDVLAANQGGVTILALGPLTNVARLLKEYPAAKTQIKQIVLLGGSLKPGDNGLPEPEFNFKADVAGTQTVFRSGIPLFVVTADTAGKVKFRLDYQQRLFTAYRPMAFQIQNLFELHGDPEPLLFDPVAIAAACGTPYGTWREMSISIDDAGRTLVGTGPSNCRVLHDLKVDDFLNWMTDRLANDGEVRLPRPSGSPSQLVPQGAFPRRVHVCEDYDTDIERRWWLSGKIETDDVPPNGRRCCRAVLTQDFDDRQGDIKTMYRAVIFNPVPGPPLGSNPRLSFRYKLAGSGDMRVQLYSLTNGYHRYLSLTGLQQGVWSHGTVDLTAMRRHDGSGSALAANERIDDIQFYVDPRASLLIDDVILFDAAAEQEQRPFPRRILFTGWFDTGQARQEWPGELDIVPHQPPRTGKFARSIAGPDGVHRLHVSLRGSRRLSAVNALSFQYLLKDATSIRVELIHAGQSLGMSVNLDRIRVNTWSETTGRFAAANANGEDVPKFVDEIRFLIPAGGVLAIDDLLLYEP